MIKKKNSSSTKETLIDGLYSENVFNNLLILERKRAERSGKPFVVVLIKLPNFNGPHSNEYSTFEKSNIQKIVDCVYQCTRDIDIKGWFSTGETIAILFTEVNLDAKENLKDKVSKSLSSNLEQNVSKFLKISSICFPDDLIPNTTGGYPIDENLISRFFTDVTQTKIKNKNNRFVKRSIDIIGCLFGIILFLPVFIIVPLLIVFTSKGPVFYKQERYGYKGRTFKMLKFRSMYASNDSSIHKQYVKSLIEGTVSEKGEKNQVFKIKDDPRVTPVGKFIRKYSLDEVPQFLNVLIGNMSLVGPRPPLPYEVEIYKIWHKHRFLHVKPGITGYWQVEGRSKTAFDSMVRMDITYIKNWSVWFDLKLILKTPITLISAKGAY